MGSTSAMVGIGGMYAHGSGVKANPAEARKWIERAAAAGDPTGMANLGAIYGSGMSVPVDFARSRACFISSICPRDVHRGFSQRTWLPCCKAKMVCSQWN